MLLLRGDTIPFGDHDRAREIRFRESERLAQIIRMDRPNPHPQNPTALNLAILVMRHTHSLLVAVIALFNGISLAAEQSLQRADEAVLRFMSEHEVHAATLAVSRSGEHLHERAFGFADRELTRPLTPAVRMRIASISKPITAAALKYLVRENKLKLGDPVLKYLPTTRYPAPVDPKWKVITIGEVLQHMGGWDRSVSGDPMFKHRTIMSDLSTNTLTPRQVVCWMLGQSVDFAPGTKSVYSNFGYCLLGVIIEEVAGCSYSEFVRSTVARDAGMTTLTLSHSQPQLRDRNETWYDFGDEGEHFLIDPMEANGGWTCTAADLTRFLGKFWMSGEPRNASQQVWVFFGSLPGTTAVAVQRPDGINYVLLMNKRDPGSEWNEQLKDLLEAAIK